MRRLHACLLSSLSLVALLTACDPPPQGERITGSTTKGEAPLDKAQIDSNALQMADKMKQSGDLEGAIAVYEGLVERNPDSVDAELELASLYRKLNRPKEALVVLKDAQGRQPQNPAVLTQLGYTQIDAGVPEFAVTSFDQLILMQPDNAQAYNGKAVAFDNAGNHLAAQELYQKARALDPNSLPIQNNLAMSLILNSQIDDAIALLQPLSSEHPDNKTVRQNLALAYGIKGEKAKALAINLKDLPAKQANENMHFYEEYARIHKLSANGKSSGHIGFAEGSDASMMVMKQEEAKDTKPDTTPQEAAPASGEVPAAAASADKNDARMLAQEPPASEGAATPAADYKVPEGYTAPAAKPEEAKPATATEELKEEVKQEAKPADASPAPAPAPAPEAAKKDATDAAVDAAKAAAAPQPVPAPAVPPVAKGMTRPHAPLPDTKPVDVGAPIDPASTPESAAP